MEISSVGSLDNECTSHNKSSSTEGLNESGEPSIQCKLHNIRWHSCQVSRNGLDSPGI